MLAAAARGACQAAMVAEVRGYGRTWYFDIPPPNTTVFGVLWPPSTALLMGVLGAPLSLSGATKNTYRYLNRLSM